MEAKLTDQRSPKRLLANAACFWGSIRKGSQKAEFTCRLDHSMTDDCRLSHYKILYNFGMHFASILKEPANPMVHVQSGEELMTIAREGNLLARPENEEVSVARDTYASVRHQCLGLLTEVQPWWLCSKG